MTTEELKNSKPSVRFQEEEEVVEGEHIVKLEVLCARLNTDCFYGLSCKQARVLLKKDGPNKYSRPASQSKPSLVRKLKGVEKHHWSKRDWDRVFNGRLDDPYVVIRDGQKSVIRKKELVRGDLVCLQPRQIVPADMRVISYDGELIVDNRIITGSMSELKTISPTSNDFLLSQNMIFACTEILSGKCEGIVLHTGDQTVFGELTQFATKVRYVKNQNGLSLSSNSSDSMSSIGNLSLPSSFSDQQSELSATSTLSL